MDILNAVGPYFVIILCAFAIIAMVFLTIFLFFSIREHYWDVKKSRLEHEESYKRIQKIK